MMERIAEASPRLKARITGAVYLLFFLTAILGTVVAGGFAPTASNILAHESQYQQ
jgi:hypothetical protein